MTDDTDLYDRFLRCLGLDTEIAKDKTTKTSAPMKVKNRVILEMAIEQGVRRGYRRAFKHVENPTEESICEHIGECVMSEVYEYFTFSEDEISG